MVNIEPVGFFPVRQISNILMNFTAFPGRLLIFREVLSPCHQPERVFKQSFPQLPELKFPGII
jgi:hypothetical protein